MLDVLLWDELPHLHFFELCSGWRPVFTTAPAGGATSEKFVFFC